ncbi:MAG: beta strand repeat-containing protein, partial [Bacteroidales bacterium]
GKDIIITITSSTTETSSAILNGNAASWTSLTIYPTTSGLSISGGLASPIIDLYGADNVIIDGRVGGTGSTKDLIISNTSTSSSSGTSTIRLYNGATSNTIKYCTVKGSSLATASGVIFLSDTSPNTANTIDNNNITCSSDANRPLNVIYSAGAANTVTISNNNIYNFFNRGITSYGINLNSSTAASTISGNSFYETNSFVPTLPIGYPFTYLADYTVININSTIAGFTVTGNFIGGSSPNCGTGGSVTVWTKTAGYSNFFTGINISVGTGIPSIVQDNTLKGFSFSNPGAAAWTGINATAGDITIGSSGHPNTIGATIGTGSITITNTTSQGGVGGINISGSGLITCDYNTIGSILLYNTDYQRSTSFMGIYRNNTNANGSISNNLIGSTSEAFSIDANSRSMSGAQNVQAIWNAGVATGLLTISNNTIANMRNQTENAVEGTFGVVNGIYNTVAANVTASGNTIYNLTIENANNTTTAASTGIVFTSASTGLITVTNNTIYNISNSFPTFTGYICGIYFAGGSGANV